MKPGAWILLDALQGIAKADLDVEGGLLHLTGRDVLTIRRMLTLVGSGTPIPEIADAHGIPAQALYDVFTRLAEMAEHPAADLPMRCVHGAVDGLCAFAGCPHYRPDGPREERWAFAPDVTEADIAAALAKNEAQHARVPGSASPIHLVVQRMMGQRLEAHEPKL